MSATRPARRRPWFGRALARSRTGSAAVLVLLLSTLGWATQPTSSAWTDPAFFTTSASSGSWQVAPVLAGPGVSVSSTWSAGSVSSSGAVACATVTVSTTSATPIPWSFDLNLAVPPWNGQTSGYSDNLGATLTDVGNDRYEVSGTASWLLVSAGQPRVDTICNFSLPAIPASASAGYYTVQTTRATGKEWTTDTACMVTTVTGNGTQPFPFQWTASLDLSPAFARVTPTVGRVQGGRSSWATTFTPALSPQQSSYVVASTLPSSISGTGSYSVTVCAYRY